MTITADTSKASEAFAALGANAAAIVGAIGGQEQDNRKKAAERLERLDKFCSHLRSIRDPPTRAATGAVTIGKSWAWAYSDYCRRNVYKPKARHERITLQRAKHRRF